MFPVESAGRLSKLPMPLGNEYLFGPKDAPFGTAPSMRLRLRTFQIPMIRDGAVIGRLAPLNQLSMKKTLRLMTREQFAGIDLIDDTIGSIVVRKSIVRKVGWERVREMVLLNIKPLMAKTEILALHLDLEIALGEKV